MKPKSEETKTESDGAKKAQELLSSPSTVISFLPCGRASWPQRTGSPSWRGRRFPSKAASAPGRGNRHRSRHSSGLLYVLRVYCIVDVAYDRKKQEKQLLGHKLYCFQHIAAPVVFLFIGISCTIILFPVRSRCVYMCVFLPSNHFERQNLRRTERMKR